jgi:hypothetical protein
VATLHSAKCDQIILFSAAAGRIIKIVAFSRGRPNSLVLIFITQSVEIIACELSVEGVRFLLIWLLKQLGGEVFTFVHSNMSDQFLACSELLFRIVARIRSLLAIVACSQPLHARSSGRNGRVGMRLPRSPNTLPRKDRVDGAEKVGKDRMPAGAHLSRYNEIVSSDSGAGRAGDDLVRTWEDTEQFSGKLCNMTRKLMNSGGTAGYTARDFAVVYMAHCNDFREIGRNWNPVHCMSVYI